MKSGVKCSVLSILCIALPISVFLSGCGGTGDIGATNALSKMQDSAVTSRKIYADISSVAKSYREDIIYWGVTGKYTSKLSDIRYAYDRDASDSSDSGKTATSSNVTPRPTTSSGVSRGSDRYMLAAGGGGFSEAKKFPTDTITKESSNFDISAYLKAAVVVEDDFYTCLGSTKVRYFIVLRGKDGTNLKINSIWEGGRLYDISAIQK